MLHQLRIKNFAIVESLDIECRAGLSVFTGETGAGKSIVVEALRFLLGGRASLEMIRTGAPSTVVEGLFDWPAGFEDTDIIAREGTTGPVWLRRELPIKGAGRCFIGDRQVTRKDLAWFAGHLADLCGQHQQQILLDPRRHTEFLDAVAGRQELVAEVRASFQKLSENITACDDLARALDKRRAHRELTAFQMAEIRDAEITPDEDERLKAEAVILKNARRLAEAADQTLNELSEADSALAARVGALLRTARKMGELDSRWNTVSERLSVWQEETEDLTRYLTEYRQRLETDPGRLDEVEARLAELFRLKAKYGGTCSAILEHLEKLDSESQADGREEERLAELKREQGKLRSLLADRAGRLTQERRASLAKLEKQINALLGKLGMPSGRLRIMWVPYIEGGLEVPCDGGSIHVFPSGAEAVRFVFEANPNEGFKPLDKIASGGELSRLLLAFKSVAVGHHPVNGNSDGVNGLRHGVPDGPLLVFDEIDAGIGGAVAYAVAKQIKSLAQNGQVFLISHLQQMAAAADTHYLTTKNTVDGRATVDIRRLDDDSRVREVARMVAGDEITDQSLQFAAELTASKKE